MLGAAAGDQEDFLVVEAGERTLEGRRGEDPLVAGLKEGGALCMDGLQRQFTDLVAREGTFNLLLAHVDGTVTLVVRLTRGIRALCDSGLKVFVRAFGAQPSTRRPRLSSCVLEDVREDAVCRVRRTRLLTRSLVGQRVPQPGQRA